MLSALMHGRNAKTVSIQLFALTTRASLKGGFQNHVESLIRLRRSHTLLLVGMATTSPNQLVSRDRNPRKRGFRPVNSDR